jgi:ribosomal 30S subunit maturation factor RimM
VGISVLVADTEELLGIVEEVAESGEYDLYIVRDEEGRLRYIPAVKKFIRSIDVSAGIMKVDLIEGL